MNKELEAIQAKIDELQAEMDRIKKQGEKPWPSSIERGMIFRHKDCGCHYLVATFGGEFVENNLICLDGCKSFVGNRFSSKMPDADAMERLFDYIPNAKTLVVQTGEALVGKVCVVSANGFQNMTKVDAYDPDKGYAVGFNWFKHAVAMEDLAKA